MIKLIKIPVINKPVLLVTAPHDVLKASRRFKIGRNLIQMIKEDPPENCQACVYQDEEKPRYVLYFKVKDLGTIVHETNHIIKHMMKLLGAQQEQEFHAYFQEYLFNEVRRSLRIKKQ